MKISLKVKMISLCAAVLVMIAAILTAVFLPGRIHRAQSQRAATAAAQTAGGYTLKEYQGKIGVFAAGKTSSPEKVLDIYITTLPQDEQVKLKAGIHIDTKAELEARMEDYTS